MAACDLYGIGWAIIQNGPILTIDKDSFPVLQTYGELQKICIISLKLKNVIPRFPHNAWLLIKLPNNYITKSSIDKVAINKRAMPATVWFDSEVNSLTAVIYIRRENKPSFFLTSDLIKSRGRRWDRSGTLRLQKINVKFLMYIDLQLELTIPCTCWSVRDGSFDSCYNTYRQTPSPYHRRNIFKAVFKVICNQRHVRPRASYATYMTFKKGSSLSSL